MPDRKERVTDGLSAGEVARVLENTQINKYHTRGGTGYAAEDANALSDKMRLRRVDVTGPSNKALGPDRIVDGVQIQTKYHYKASRTVAYAFDSRTGLYKYSGQVLEVPLDQYEEAVKIMEEKIRSGKVPGYADPADARLLVKRGSLTYKQARNIAKAGNIDSITFDLKTQAVTTTYIFAISFAVGYARAVWSGQPKSEAIRTALASAVSAGATTAGTGVAAAQFLRTRAAALGAVYLRDGVRVVNKTPLGKAAIEKIAQASLRKSVHGAAAVNHVAKLLRSNIVSAAVATAVTTTPDLYRALVSKSISWSQFSKNLAVNASRVGGGIGGWMAGAALGAAVGGPVGAAVGGLIGALGGGFAGASGAKYIGDRILEDDAKQVLKLVQKASEELAYEYLLSEAEIQVFAKELDSIIDGAWLRRMYQAGNKGGDWEALCLQFARDHLEPICEKIIAQREQVTLPEPHEIQQEIADVLNLLEPDPA